MPSVPAISIASSASSIVAGKRRADQAGDAAAEMDRGAEVAVQHLRRARSGIARNSG